MKKDSSHLAIVNSLAKFFILLISLSLSFIGSKVADVIIKPSNPYDILNLYSAQGFSPEQNFLRIILIIVLTITLYALLNALLRKRPGLFRLFIVILIPFIILNITYIPLMNSLHNNLDSFHHGEQLSPANDLLKGKKLYSDIFALHGAGEDVIIPSIAIKLGGNGNHAIGTYYFITMLFGLISAGLFISLLSLLFRNTTAFLAVSFWLTFSVYSSFFYVRDIFTWLICLLIAYILIHKRWLGRHSHIVFAGLGAFASFSLFYTVDRGIIACLLVGLMGAVTIFTGHSIENKGLSFKIPKKLSDFKLFGSMIAGGLIVQIIFMAVIGFTSYFAFLSSIFIDIPRYQGLLFDYPLPALDKDSFLLWLPIFLVPAMILMVVKMFIHDRRLHGVVDSRLIYAIILIFASILFLRVGYGRSDWGHIAYSTPLLFVTLFYTIWLYFSKFTKQYGEYWIPIITICLLFIPVTTVNVDQVNAFINSRPSQIKNIIDLPTTNDSLWVNQGMSEVTSYIKQNTTPNEPIFVFTQQPIYYYLTDRMNPTRFYIPWFADPTPLENEMLHSLINRPPKIIVYSSGTGWDNVDGYAMSLRAPRVDRWIKDNYKTKHTINGVLLLER